MDEARPGQGRVPVMAGPPAWRFAVLSPTTASVLGSVLGAVVVVLVAVSVPLAGLAREFPRQATPAIAPGAADTVQPSCQSG